MTDINFASFPVFTTERLTLRQPATDDQRDIFALRSDPEVNKYLGRQPSKTIEDAINFINKINDNFEKNSSIYWIITRSNTKEFVGTICLYDFSKENNSCEIGYELLPKFQGQGIMKEATEKIIEYAFQTMQFKKIVAVTHKDNQNSSKLLEKFDFKKSMEPDIENADLNIYTLTNSN